MTLHKKKHQDKMSKKHGVFKQQFSRQSKGNGARQSADKARQSLNAPILLKWQEDVVRKWTDDNMYKSPLLEPHQENTLGKWSEANFEDHRAAVEAAADKKKAADKRLAEKKAAKILAEEEAAQKKRAADQILAEKEAAEKEAAEKEAAEKEAAEKEVDVQAKKMTKAKKRAARKVKKAEKRAAKKMTEAEKTAANKKAAANKHTITEANIKPVRYAHLTLKAAKTTGNDKEWRAAAKEKFSGNDLKEYRKELKMSKHQKKLLNKEDTVERKTARRIKESSPVVGDQSVDTMAIDSLLRSEEQESKFVERFEACKTRQEILEYRKQVNLYRGAVAELEEIERNAK